MSIAWHSVKVHNCNCYYYWGNIIIIIEINAHYYLHPYFNIYMHQIIKGLWRRSYPRKDSCGIGTHKVEIQPTIDLVEYGGLWPACGGGKSGGYRRDDGCGFLSPSPIGFHYHRDIIIIFCLFRNKDKIVCIIINGINTCTILLLKKKRYTRQYMNGINAHTELLLLLYNTYTYG